jgi:hypothetical protein
MSTICCAAFLQGQEFPARREFRLYARALEELIEINTADPHSPTDPEGREHPAADPEAYRLWDSASGASLSLTVRNL